jgi:hypothetical protein
MHPRQITAPSCSRCCVTGANRHYRLLLLLLVLLLLLLLLLLLVLLLISHSTLIS